MKRYSSYTILVCTIVFILNGCSNTVKTSNTVGDWYQTTSQNMGGFLITAETRLTISRIAPGEYKYRTETTVIDDMYGGSPKTQYSSGKLLEDITNKEWRFIGGSWGERGAYIEVPDDYWNNYVPSEITISFLEGRGNRMIFKRSIQHSKESGIDPSSTVDAENTAEPQEELNARMNGKSTYEMLQGKWQSTTDGSNFLIFEKNNRKEIAEGMDVWDIEEFVISSKCENNTDAQRELEAEKDKYLSVKASDLCWYIVELNSSTLSLSYMGRGNTLNYIRVK